MDERQANNETIAGLFAHIVQLRREMQRIGDETRDPDTKLHIRRTLEKSLRMPPEEAKE